MLLFNLLKRLKGIVDCFFGVTACEGAAMMAHGSIRLRLTFDRDLTSDALHNLTRYIMYQPQSMPPDIGGLASLIQHNFGINVPEGLALSVGIWKLPPCSSTTLLRDDDSVKVTRGSGRDPSLQMGCGDRGRGNTTQPASAEATLAKPSNTGADAFVSAYSGPEASEPGMPAVSLTHAAAPASGPEQNISEESDPEIPEAEIQAAQKIYESVMRDFPSEPGIPGMALLQADQASGPAASQPSMPAVSRPPPAVAPKKDTSEDSEEYVAKMEARKRLYEEMMANLDYGEP